MNIWTWVEEFGEQAAEAKDIERIKLFQLAVIALPMIREDTDRALELMLHGRRIAEELGERRWVLFLDHWRTQALLWHKRDYSALLDILQPALEEASHTEFDDFPQRVCLHEDLIGYYLGTDPDRYEAEIQNSIAVMQAEMSPGAPCRNCLNDLCTEIRLEFGRLEEAEAAGVDAIKAAWPVSDYHHIVSAYAQLCQIAFAQRDWKKLKHWSDSGVLLEGRGGEDNCAVELRMWQALASRMRDDLETARKQYKAARVIARHTVGLTAGYYNALCAYYEAGGERKHALVARTRELKMLLGKGQTALECRARLARLRLLAALGRPIENDYSELQIVAMRLGNPSKVLNEAAAVAT